MVGVPRVLLTSGAISPVGKAITPIPSGETSSSRVATRLQEAAIGSLRSMATGMQRRRGHRFSQSHPLASTEGPRGHSGPLVPVHAVTLTHMLTVKWPASPH
jgi:hypothetical protein